MDSDLSAFQADERPEITLDRTRHLLARSRQTIDAANRRLGKDQEQPDAAPGQVGESSG